MKTALLAILATILMAAPAAAELQFPEFEQQTKQAQASWGYKITRTKGKNPSFSVTVPPKAAAKCSAARLSIRSKTNKLLAQFDVTPVQRKDGSLVFTVALFEDLDGNAELIVYTDHVPGAALLPNFGGFTFKAKIADPADRTAANGKADATPEAVRKLMRAYKAKIDGTRVPADWPEKVRQPDKGTWVVDIDTSKLPGGYPEQIVVTVGTAGGHSDNPKR